MAPLLETNLLVSTTTILVVLCLSEVIRRLLIGLVPVKHGGLLQICLEFVVSFELLAVAYERGILMHAYGVLGSATPLFLVSLWRGYFWKRVKVAPTAILEDWICGRVSWIFGIVLVMSQLAGGFLAFQYFNRQIWAFGFSEAHAAKYAAGSACSWAFKKHDLEAGVYEVLFSFTFGIVCRFLGTFMPTSPLTPIIKASLFTYLVMAGGIMHPILACVLQYGCSGITPFQHVMVYWVATTLGGIGSYFVCKLTYTDKLTTPIQKEDKETEKKSN